MTKASESACTSFLRATSSFFVWISVRRLALLMFVSFNLAPCSAQEFSLSPLPFNSKLFDEFAPLQKGKDVYFISNRKPELLATLVTGKGEYAPSLFVWRNDKVNQENNGENDFTGPFTFNPSGELIFTGISTGNTLGLYIKNPEGNTDQFPFNSPEYSISQPFLNRGGDTLYFSSDLPGGKGGADLYYSVLSEGQWMHPVNLETFNSEYMELFPALDQKGNLVFSSDRGGNYDIYIAAGNSLPIPLPHPINSPRNEISFLPTDSGNALLVSDRLGSQDIFSVDNLTPPCNEKIPWRPTELCYTFFEESSLGEGSEDLEYEWNINSVRYPGNEASHCFEGPGEYLVELNIIDRLSGDLYFNEVSITHRILPEKQISAARILEGIVLDSAYTFLPDISNPVFYAEIPGSWMKPIAPGEIISTADVSEITLAVRGKTVNGNDTCLCFFQVLSEKEKNTATLKETRMEPLKKVFQKQPEESKEEVFRLEILRSREKVADRQKEFSFAGDSIVTEEWYLPEDSMYSYTLGETDAPEKLLPFYQIAKAAGHREAMVKAFDREKVLSLEDVAGGADVSNSVLRIGNIYFESGSAKIMGESLPILTKVGEILNQRPDLIVEIAAHTDSQGSHESNLELSNQRGASIKSFLEEKGVKSDRLISTGFGESKPVSGNDTEQGRALNRRIEFRFTESKHK